jgi:hypothetical protein
MRSIFILILVLFAISSKVVASENESTKLTVDRNEVVWTPGMNVETLWLNYSISKGGLTWGESTVYPEYAKVKEGDTLLIQTHQGSCLMEFFHSRWRRANDVKRWDDSINTYGGCPNVFD